MQRLGRVLYISPSRNVIVRVENIPKIGDIVVDESLKPVGKVFDVIGPVSAPYVTVKPAIRELERLESKILYLNPSNRRKEKKRHEWR